MVEHKLIFADYEEIRSLGSGAFGKVFMVRDVALGIHYAVKVMLRPTPRARVDAAFELNAWADLPRHQNLVSLYFVRSEGNALGIFMEYVDGKNGEVWLTQDRPTQSKILQFTLDIAYGLAVAHAAKIVHGDLSPRNMLFAKDGRAKLTDFGMAERITQPPTSTRTTGGSKTYNSPEQEREEPINAASDVWSFCATLVHLILGKPAASQGKDLHYKVESIVKRLPVNDAHPFLAEIVRGVFQREPRKRLQLDNVIVLLERALLALGDKPFLRDQVWGSLAPAPLTKVPTDELDELWKNARASIDYVKRPQGSDAARSLADLVLCSELFRIEQTNNVDPQAMNRLQRLRATLAEGVGDKGTAISCLRFVLLSADSAPFAERVQTQLDLAQLLLSAGNYAEAAVLGDLALRLAEESFMNSGLNPASGVDGAGVTTFLFRALQLEAMALSLMGDFEAANRVWERYLDTVGSGPTSNVLAVVRALARCELEVNRDDQGLEASVIPVVDEAIVLVESLMNDPAVLSLAHEVGRLCNVAVVYYARRGDFSSAVRYGTKAVDVLGPLVEWMGVFSPAASRYVKALSFLGRVKYHLGDATGAEESLAEGERFLIRAVVEGGNRTLLEAWAALKGGHADLIDSFDREGALALRTDEISMLRQIIPSGSHDAIRLMLSALIHQGELLIEGDAPVQEISAASAAADELAAKYPQFVDQPSRQRMQDITDRLELKLANMRS